MSYEGGGGAQGPAGPTGPTGADGATGGISFSGPTGAVLWYDGTGVTGTTGLTWTETGGMGEAYRLFGGPNGNYLELDSIGNMSMWIDQISAGHGILLAAGNTQITLTDAIAGESGATGQLQVLIDGNAGASGDVLTSDGTNTIWQAPVARVYTASAYGQTGATGALTNNGPAGTQLMSTTISTGVTGNILGQVAIQLQNSDNASEHAVGVYLVVGGSTGGTTTYNIPKQQAGLNGSANLTIFHRTSTTEPTGIYTISVYGYSDTETDVFYDHIDLVGLGNLDGPDAPV